MALRQYQITSFRAHSEGILERNSFPLSFEFSFEELKALLASRSAAEIRKYCTTQEAWIIVKGLPREEKALLGQMILAELGGLPDPS